MSIPWQALSYLLDWILVIIFAGIGAALYKIRGNSRAFSLTDLAISYPYVGDTISITTDGVLALLVPAVITAVLSLLLKAPRESNSSSLKRPSEFRRKLWVLHLAWLGLVVSAVGAFFLTSALKDIIGKPRPDLLARCQPDVSRVSEFAVGGLGASVQGAPILVTMGICQNSDVDLVYDGFAAFPSGHSSFAFAGLLYLTLWLLQKFSAIPIRGSNTVQERPQQSDQNNYEQMKYAARATEPSLALVISALVPVVGAACIAATRYHDNQHSGWDILAGSLLGSGFAWFGFRLYHPSLHYGSYRDAWTARNQGAVYLPAGPAHTRDGANNMELGLLPGSNGH